MACQFAAPLGGSQARTGRVPLLRAPRWFAKVGAGGLQRAWEAPGLGGSGGGVRSTLQALTRRRCAQSARSADEAKWTARPPNRPSPGSRPARADRRGRALRPARPRLCRAISRRNQPPPSAPANAFHHLPRPSTFRTRPAGRTPAAAASRAHIFPGSRRALRRIVARCRRRLRVGRGGGGTGRNGGGSHGRDLRWVDPRARQTGCRRMTPCGERPTSSRTRPSRRCASRSSRATRRSCRHRPSQRCARCRPCRS